MREMLKKQVQSCISQQIETTLHKARNGQYGPRVTDQRLGEIIAARVLEALDGVVASAIMDGMDKIRISDMLHVAVKLRAPGKYKDFVSGEILERPASFSAVVARTPAMTNALKWRQLPSGEL